MTVILLGVSIVFQLVAAGMALWFIRVSQRRLGWILMAAAILLMAVRRSITLIQSLQSGGAVRPELYAESVALLISILMCAGVYWIGGFFRESREDRSRLRESESRYRALYDEVSDGIILADIQGGHLEPNPSAERLFGYTKDEFSKLHAVNLFVPEDLVAEPIELDSLREGKKLLKTRRLIRKDGSIFHAEISSTLLATGQLVAMIRDITSRRESEKALRENDAHLRAVLNSVFDAIVTVDLSGTIVDCNRGTCSMFRERREQLVDAEIFAFMPELRDRWAEIEGVSDSADEALRWEMQARDGLGRDFPVELSVTSVELESEKRVVVAIRDLTRWKELQGHVVQTQKMEALGTLAGGVAHDFNNVLMVVLGSLEMALEDIGSDQPVKVGLERAFGAAKRGRDLVNQILTFSRMEAFEMSPVDVGAMMKEAVALLRPVLPASIDLKCDIDAKLPSVMGNKTQLQQVFMNLVTNAYQSYGGEPGKVLVSCRPKELKGEGGDGFGDLAPGSYLELSVLDFGGGIPASLRDRIFDPFFTTKKEGEGTGMGLSVVLGIIEQHGGGIEVETDEGKGSHFRVLFPVSLEALGDGLERSESLIEGRGELILLVDDQDSVLLMGKRLLERIGFKCEACSDADHAMEFFREHRGEVALIVTDLAMPGKSGLAFAGEVRGMGSEIPIVLTTGNPSGLSEELMQEHGVTRLLSKPFSLGELSDCLAEVLWKGSGER